MTKRPDRPDPWKGVAHYRVRLEGADSPAFRVLSFSAKALYGDLRAKMRSNNNGNINATLSEMRHRGWTSSATLSKALQELEAMGFIAKTRQGGIAANARYCSLYRFTDTEVWEWPKLGIGPIEATNEYKAFGTVREAEVAMKNHRDRVTFLQKARRAEKMGARDEKK
ncbi:hypothetical protein GPA27_01825 [Aromatoleum toluolicum]|uniref:Helix-turn-helix domain-containing protein n=1 Tax=Aromatoleum toluolicum TaxID=90060 RepID=A0ABX1NA29_9RHOO|nr:hypothetical protein [Aromatoleum toluolicum]NMF96136.1 hypothetical protein [Aromatoleum toluolicum]